MLSQTGLHKLSDVVFDISQNRFILHHQTLSGNRSLIKESFLMFFVTLMATGH